MRIGTPGTPGATRLVLLGSGELGREVAIEAMRLGCEVVAVDRYDGAKRQRVSIAGSEASEARSERGAEHAAIGAPAMQVAHRRHVIDMTDPVELSDVLAAERERPHGELFVVPELEAIATPVLVELEAGGLHVVPTARATRLTMDREGIRRLAAEELSLPTSPYRFCDSESELADAVAALGVPCVVKPVMSSSGKGQSVVRAVDEVGKAWAYAQAGGRTGAGRVIAEGFVEFDYEITLLTVRHAAGTSFCAPIGHRQVDGDYRESWQPQSMSMPALTRTQEIAAAVTDSLGGQGIFGVELFVRGDEVLFSEVSPRPHDTGMVTMVTQSLSEFALHVRAILGLPVPAGEVPLIGPGASAVVLGASPGAPTYDGLAAALAVGDEVTVRLFGKPEAPKQRRLGVALARAATVDQARADAHAAAAAITVH